MTLRKLRATVCLALTLAGGAAALRAQDLWVYDNALAGGFADWSWATHNLAATGDVHSAPNAVELGAGQLGRASTSTTTPASTAPTISPCGSG